MRSAFPVLGKEMDKPHSGTSQSLQGVPLPHHPMTIIFHLQPAISIFTQPVVNAV